MTFVLVLVVGGSPPYIELEHGGRGEEEVKGLLGGNIDPSLTSLAGAASAGSSCRF